MSYNLVDPTTGDLTRVAGNSNIVDTSIGIDSTWSSKKISADLADKQDFRIFNSLEEFNEKKGTSLTVVSGVDNMKDIVNAMSNGEILIIITKYKLGSEVYFGLTKDTGWTKMFTFVKSNGLCDVECRTTFPLTLKRVLNSDGVIGDWQELATTTEVAHIKRFDSVPGNDWNNAIEEGYYSIPFDMVADEIANKPFNYAIQVRVIKSDINDSNYVYQIAYVSSQDSRIFIRKLKGDGNWTPWQQLATTDNVAREVDTSYMSNGVLNISSIRRSLGVGCYEIMGQGNSGHGSIRLNIWQVSSGAFAFSCCITDFSGVRSICNNEGDSTTVDVGTSYFATTNRIVKIF